MTTIVPTTEQTYEVALKIVRLPKGGYVLAEIGEHGGPVQAVSNLNELIGAISGHLLDWDKDVNRLIKAQFEDENPNVVAPKKWWRAVK